MSVMATEITGTWVVVQRLIHADIIENIKAPIYRPFVGESACNSWIPPRKG